MTRLDYAQPALRREIGLFGAVMLGLGSILGTGVFVSLAHATELAGPWVLLAIVLAGLLAYCNAMSSAQLAAAYPVSGGTYEYGYRVLNPALGFTAGWMFLLAKSASAATAALALGHMVRQFLISATYEITGGNFVDFLMPISGRYFDFELLFRPPILAIITLAILGSSALAGLKRSNRSITLAVCVTVFSLVVFSTTALVSGSMSPRITTLIAVQLAPQSADFGTGWQLSKLLGAAAVTFVAFTGYGRLATMGEEVSNPKSTIPKAINAALLISMVLYFSVALAYVCLIEQAEVSYEHVPTVVEFSRFIDIAQTGRTVQYVMTFAAVTAMLGVLLNLILGLSRVWLAMGRRGDMPRLLASVNVNTSTPVPATILSGVVIALLVLVGDVRTTWSFSAFTVLIYYAITNLACLRLAPEHRRYPRSLAWVGLFACLSLAWFVEMKVWIAGTILIGIGLIWFRIRRSWRTDVG